MLPKTYLRSLYLSFTSIEYYLAVLRAPLAFSLRFFLISFVLIGIWAGLRTATEFGIFVRENSPATLKSIEENFPENGSVVWNGDRLQIEPDPFYVGFPPFLSDSEGLPEHFAVLTADQATPVLLLEQLDTSAWIVVTKDLLYSYNFLNEWSSVPISELDEDRLVLITSQTLPQHLETVRQWIDEAIPIIQFALPFFVTPLLIVSRLWMALVNAVLAFFFLRINQVQIPFSKSLQLALQLLVPLEFINQLAAILYPTLEFSLISLGFWALLVYLYLSQRKQLRELFSESK